MAVQVTNLIIGLQDGTENTLYATWNFTEPTSSGSSSGGGSGSSSSSVKAGSIVTVKSGAKWYNGVAISSFVFNYRWVVYEVKGDRVVINKDTTGAYAIMSAIHVNNLTVVG